MEKKQERRGLGRGLSALMADVNLGPTPGAEAPAAAPRRTARSRSSGSFPNPLQPRRDFAAGSLEDLAASIRQRASSSR